MTKNQTIELGDLVKDKVTGFTGIVSAYSRFLSGCDRVSVQPRDLKDGGVRMTEAFDILQLEIVEKAAVIVETRAVVDRTGGPRPDVTQRPGAVSR
jgi:hypothetical protein